MGSIRAAAVTVLAVLALGAPLAAPASATNNSVMAWGINNVGELGIGSFTAGSECPTMDRCSATPVAVSGLSEVASVAGGGEHSLALLNNGTVMAWGNGGMGALGRGTTESSSVPVAVEGLSGVVAVSAGYHFSLALLSNGKVMAWGWNSVGQLGDGSTTDRHVPVEVSGLEHVKAISAGFGHSLALRENGTVVAWGANDSGQLGNESTIDSDVPVEVSGLGEEVTAVSAGGFSDFDDEHSLALLASGHVVAWGGNEYGQLGDGTTTNAEVPVEIPALSGVTAVAAGGLHSLALLSGGSVRAWGWAERGELGDGSHTGPEKCGSELNEACSTSPVEVEGLSGVTSVAAGWFYSAAIRADHRVTTWGWNGYDELGDNTGVEQSDVPVTVIYLQEVAAVAAGGEHVLALRSANNPPEFGRCIKVAKTTGRYGTGSCTAMTEEPDSFEWYPGLEQRSFTAEASSTATLEAASGFKVVCSGEKGTGEYSSPATVGGVVMKFSGCEANGIKCTSTGASVGEVVTNTLKGVLGVEKVSAEGPAKNKIALALSPAVEAEAFAKFSCGYQLTVIGSVLMPVKSNTMQLTPKRDFKATKAKQKPEALEGGPTQILEESLEGLPFNQAGLAVETLQSNEESAEVNSAA